MKRITTLTLLLLFVLPAAAGAASLKQRIMRLEKQSRQQQALISSQQLMIEDLVDVVGCFQLLRVDEDLVAAASNNPLVFDAGSAYLDSGILNYFAPTLYWSPRVVRVITPTSVGQYYEAFVNPACVGAPRKHVFGMVQR